MALPSKLKTTELLTYFDYQQLSPQKRTIVQQYTGEIKERLRRTAQDVWEVGQKLTEVRSQLEHGQFEGWLSAEFGWSRRTAYNFINVYEAFSDSTNFDRLDIATSALYKLAAPSTPESVRKQFLDNAQKGAKITHKQISQALSNAKNSRVLPQPQPKEPPAQKILKVIPQASTEELAAQQVPTNPIVQTPISSEPIMTKTSIEIKSGFWYLFDRVNFVFCGDTASAEFRYRSPNATLALAITSDDWDHDWLIEKASNLIVLRESYLNTALIEQVISLFSEEGDTVIFPWLPHEKILAIAHRSNRRIVAGDPNPQRCQKAIAQVGLPFEQLTFSTL